MCCKPQGRTGTSPISHILRAGATHFLTRPVSRPIPILPLVDRLGAVADLELHENLVLKLMDRRKADAHLVGNFLVKQALPHVPHHFVLARRERRTSFGCADATDVPMKFSRAWDANC